MVVGAAGVANRNSTRSEIFQRGEPLLEDRPHHFIALQVDAANTARAIVDIEVSREFIVLRSRLHHRRIGEVRLHVSRGAQQAFFLSAPERDARTVRSILRLSVFRRRSASRATALPAALSVAPVP